MGRDMASVFKALSNPHRLRIFRALMAAHGDRNVQEIAADCCGLALSTVSHHLKELRLAGLVRCERDGQQVLCTIAPDAVAMLHDFINALHDAKKAN